MQAPKLVNTDAEGRIRINPVFLWGIATYMLAVAVAAGIALAQLAAARDEISNLRSALVNNVRSRAEVDEIVRRMDTRMDFLQEQVSENKQRLSNLEKYRGIR